MEQAGRVAGEGRPAPETLLEFLRAGEAWLKRRGLSSPRLEAELLLCHTLGLERLRLYLEFDRPLAPEESDGYRKLLLQRGQGVPLAYLRGEREFYSLAFRVDPRVLIPRPETELLVEASLALGEQPTRFADVGTGSGCIAVTLAHLRPAWRGFALDLAPDALEVAVANASRHGVLERIRFLTGDLLAPLAGVVEPGGLDLVVSNPPYVQPSDPDLDPMVARHEPGLALFAGPGGVEELWRRLAAGAAVYLRSGGILAVECGKGQAQALVALLEGQGEWQQPRQLQDLGGVPRVVVAQRL